MYRTAIPVSNRPNNANRGYVNRGVGKPFCKICKDAGKSPEEYTSHNIRNDKKKVVCPTLLNQSCFHCAGLGHTPKYCPQRKRDEKFDRRRNYKNRVEVVQMRKREKQDANARSYFGVLDEIDLEDVKEAEVKENPIVTKEVEENPNSYANRLKANMLVQDGVKTVKEQQTPEPSYKDKIVVPSVKIIPILVPRPRFNWADECDTSSDEEDEEDDDYSSMNGEYDVNSYCS